MIAEQLIKEEELEDKRAEREREEGVLDETQTN